MASQRGASSRVSLDWWAVIVAMAAALLVRVGVVPHVRW
jgi:hypothetical protein